MRWLLVLSASLALASGVLAATPPQKAPVVPLPSAPLVGTVGKKTATTGTKVVWVYDFTKARSLNIIGPGAPDALFGTTRDYKQEARFSASGLTGIDVDPLWTGYLDQNQGVSCGFNALSLRGYLAETARQATAADIACAGYSLNQISSMINTAGAVMINPVAANTVVEALVRTTGYSPGGWHSDLFWTNSAQPLSNLGVASSDQWNIEGNSKCLGQSWDQFGSGGVSVDVGTKGPLGGNDFQWHIWDQVFNTTSVTVYLDGVLVSTEAITANSTGKPEQLLSTAHTYPLAYDPSNGAAPNCPDTFSSSAWSTSYYGGEIDLGWIAIYQPNAAIGPITPQTTQADILVDYAANGSVTLPSLTALWGSAAVTAGVTDYVEAIPTEPGLAPGMGEFTTFNQFPSCVSYNSGTRVISVTSPCGNSGYIPIEVEPKLSDGSVVVPFRFAFDIGPHFTASLPSLITFTLNTPITPVSLYPDVDAGNILPKTFSATGLPTGLSISSKGVLSGTPTSAGSSTPTLTSTNAASQAVSSSGLTISVVGGPGDIVSGASAWYGLRAYNAAYAAATGKAFNLRRASDSTAQDFNILTTGQFDIASANAFAGTDATASCTIASTTLTCTGASSTPHAGSTLTGTGINQPTAIVSCGAFTGGAGTCTLSIASTVSVAETVTMQYGLFVVTAYDQSGNTRNITQSTHANQPHLFPSCINGLPCMGVLSTESSSTLVGPSITPASGEVSFSTLWDIFNSGANIGVLRENGANNRINSSASSTINMIGGSSGSFTATLANSVTHAQQSVMNGASSVINIDGTETTGTATGNTTAGAITLFSGTPGLAYIGEAGFWDNAGFTGTQRTNLCNDQRYYWGTAGTC